MTLSARLSELWKCVSDFYPSWRKPSRRRITTQLAVLRQPSQGPSYRVSSPQPCGSFVPSQLLIQALTVSRWESSLQIQITFSALDIEDLKRNLGLPPVVSEAELFHSAIALLTSIPDKRFKPAPVNGDEGYHFNLTLDLSLGRSQASPQKKLRRYHCQAEDPHCQYSWCDEYNLIDPSYRPTRCPSCREPWQEDEFEPDPQESP